MLMNTINVEHFYQTRESRNQILQKNNRMCKMSVELMDTRFQPYVKLRGLQFVTRDL